MVKIDYSKLALFHQCERAYYWEHVKNIVPKTTIKAFEVGQYLHKSITAINLDLPIPDYNIEATKPVYSPENIKKLLDEYKIFSAKNKILSNNFNCELKLTRKIRKHIHFVGVIDMWDMENNILYEFKHTASNTAQKNMQSFDYSPQLMGYQYLANSPDVIHRLVMLDLKTCQIHMRHIVHDKLTMRSFEIYIEQMGKLLQTKKEKRNYVKNLHFCRGQFPTWSECCYIPLCFTSPTQTHTNIKLMFDKKERR